MAALDANTNPLSWSSFHGSCPWFRNDGQNTRSQIDHVFASYGYSQVRSGWPLWITRG